MGETVPFNRKDGDSHTPKDERIYSNEEVSEIIGAALRNAQTDDGSTVNHEEMMSIAGEFGLGGADIQRALDDLAEKQNDEDIADQVVLALKLHIATFVVVNVGLLFINLLTSPSYPWFLFPVVCWGSIVVLHGIVVKFVPTAAWLMLNPHDKGFGVSPTRLGQSGRAAFYIDNVYNSFAKADGIVEMTDDALILEFEIRDSIFGAIKSGVKEEVVPLEEIAGVRLQRGMWNTKLCLQGRRLSTFSSVPESKGGEITLMFRREYRSAVEHLARGLSERIGR